MTDFSAFPRFTAFRNKTLLAIDYGRVASGVAYFTPGLHPYPLTLEKIVMPNPFKGQENKFLEELRKTIDNESVDILVLGLPTHADGKHSAMTEEVLKIKELILANFSLPLYLQDETYTTEEAKRRMLNSPEYNFKIDVKKIDSLAAQIILEDFICSKSELI